MVAQYSPHTVIADLEPATTIDLDGADILTRISRELARKDVKLLLARVPPEAIGLLSRAGTLDAIGRDHLYASVRAAVDAARERTETEVQGALQGGHPRGPVPA
jgi:MFS superfamily sulfate permease-like transporter